jgi:hypothetical protein
MRVQTVLKFIGYVVGAIFIPGGGIIAARKIYKERENILDKLRSVRNWFRRTKSENKPVEKIEAPSIIEEIEKDLMNPEKRICVPATANKYTVSTIKLIRDRFTNSPTITLDTEPKQMSSKDRALRQLAEKLRPLAEERVRTLQFNKNLRELGVAE